MPERGRYPGGGFADILIASNPVSRDQVHRPLEIRQLRYFVGVVEAGSFTKAASRLNIAQSALSFHVRQLEDMFGTQLLVRGRTGVGVTASGARLLDHARTILKQVHQARAELTNPAGRPAGEVTIGVPSGAARVLSGDLLEAVGHEFPAVSLKMIEGMTGQLEEWMAAGRFNLAVLYRTAEGVGQATVLAREELCLVAPAGKAPFSDTIPVSELHAFPLAMPMHKHNVRRSVADVMVQHGRALDVRFEVDSLSTIINIVAEGKGYSILSPSSVQKEARQGLVRLVRIVEPVITRSVILAVNRSDEDLPAVVAVHDLIARVAGNLVATGRWPLTAS